MVSVVDVVGLLVLLGVNTATAALLTRLFRVRLSTAWGPPLYAGTLGALALVVSTMVIGAILGPDLGSAGVVVGVAVVLPLAVGVSFDYFWMPAPEEVDLPAKYQS
jgi:cell division protein FtsW (lipid II flippase)